ncbi:VRR-NUC domain-containing protein [Sphingopyxis sp. BSN-002]|uniref:VRR-NUC domain-containing protein n=1 Tax=Sphingopyxis sp. BSN-002 TaxID=2911495 RepID=UPI001EDA55AF|nr:VRR-NUC domain-containing protein [Sphingopyxis sp. BSN-002]QVJ07661.1 VRR-NUC domain protein [Sphingopyxis phage VSN-002]UKK84737.1 VRR-NUC domain-containing protein [Sphingopyxis sp. BSN-002]
MKQPDYAPVADCRAAGWHYDEVGVARTAYGRSVSELAIQASIVKDLPRVIPCMVSAVPNGTHIASKAGRGKAQREGLATGYPDLIIDGIGPNAGKVCRAEIKASGDVKLSQYAMLNRLHEAGHICGIFRSLDTLIGFLVAHGWESREAVPIGAVANRVLGRILVG